MNNDDRTFMHIVFNQEQNLHDKILAEFRQLNDRVGYMLTWIEDFHNPEVFENEEEKVQLLATLTKINAIWEEEVQ